MRTADARFLHQIMVALDEHCDRIAVVTSGSSEQSVTVSPRWEAAYDGPFRRRLEVDWLLAIGRIAGVSSPLTAWLVQLQAEIDRAGAKALAERVRKLEDPVSGLHPDVPEVAKVIYSAMTDEDEAHVWFDADFYNTFSKPLAVLEARGLIKGEHTIGNRYHDGLRVIDPSFIMYMCALCESD